VALRGETSDAASVLISGNGEVSKLASMLVEITGAGQVSEPASIWVALPGEVADTASVLVALRSEVSAAASLRTNLFGVVVAAASMTVRPGGYVTLSPINDQTNIGPWLDELGGGTDVYQSVDEIRHDDSDYAGPVRTTRRGSGTRDLGRPDVFRHRRGNPKRQRPVDDLE
jgi:hypothetical protein